MACLRFDDALQESLRLGNSQSVAIGPAPKKEIPHMSKIKLPISGSGLGKAPRRRANIANPKQNRNLI